jgi:putative CocE/NonD family hydrolase
MNPPSAAVSSLLSILILAAAGRAEAPVVRFPKSPPPRNDVRVENHVAMPMRDGVVLYADVYRPALPGKHPVILSRTPYSTEAIPTFERRRRTESKEPLEPLVDVGPYFAARGFVFVYQDVRGRFESDGRFEPFRNDIEDGYDSVEWCARQEWSNGKVGMQGGSYLGHVQWRAAMSAPPHLVALFPNVASTSLYHNWVTLNGAWRLSFNLAWGAGQESRVQQNMEPHSMESAPEGISYARALRHLPLIEMPELLGRHPSFWRDWVRHPDYDAYWKSLNAEEVFDKITVPVHAFGGWFDIFSDGTLKGYAGMARRGGSPAAREKSRLVIGPWGHGPTRRFGDLDFGEEAFVDRLALEAHWYDYWLRGVDNGLAAAPPVTLFVMGRNVWREEREYPLARARATPMYLSSGGHANSHIGDGRLSWTRPSSGAEADHYTYDPDRPVPSVGGNQCCGTPTPTGPRDQRAVESRSDVLVYTSDFLQEEVEVTGPVTLVLFAASDAVDTDFVAKLVDVYPDGHAFNVAEGIVRARYREGVERARLLEPGTVYRFEISLVGTSNAFLRGHRIRVDVTSSHFPHFDRNPNTGETFGAGTAVKIARQTVRHTAAHPSHILLPVVPAGP